MSKRITQQTYESKIFDKTNGEYTVASEYLGMEHPIKIRHNSCNKEYMLKCAGNAYHQKLCCPHCRFLYVDEDYPELAKNFKDQSKIHIVKSSKEVVELVCPCCGRSVFMDVMHYIRKGRVQCDTCGDGYSYPEKYIANVLTQLGINYVYQFSPDWANGYRYDFQFEHDNQFYILEVDGGMGHGYHDVFGQDKYEKLEIDIDKERLAYEHGYKVLRIDCNYENYYRADYIRNNAISVLSSTFDLSGIDWKQCDLYAAGSLFQKVIEIYKTQTKYKDEIAQILNIKVRTVEKYLGDAMNSGLLSKRIIRSKVQQKTGRKKGSVKIRPIYCYEDALVFQTTKEASEYYGCKENSLRVSINKAKGYYMNRHFVYVDKLPKDFAFTPIFFPEEEYERHVVCQYTIKDELVRIYLHKRDLPKVFQYNNIWRAAQSKRNTAYGFKWKFLSKQEEFELCKLLPKDNSLGRFYFYAR